MARTALERYALLETVGDYTEGDAPPREVVAKFGEATLTLYGTDDVPITHWALATLRSRPARQGELCVAPGADSDEQLLLRDADMIEALRLSCPDLSGTRPKPKRRPGLMRVGLAAMLVIAGLALIPHLPTYLVWMIPPLREDEIGRQIEARAAVQTPAEQCDTPEGMAALATLSARLTPAGERPLTIRVYDRAEIETLAYPGRTVVLTRGVLGAAQSPEELAGLIAHELAHVARRDPMHLVADRLGSTGMAGLLLRGTLDPRRLDMLVPVRSGAAETEIEATAGTYRRLADAGLPSAPWEEFLARLPQAPLPPGAHLATTARMLTPRGESADTAFDPALDDQTWVALRGMCDR